MIQSASWLRSASSIDPAFRRDRSSWPRFWIRRFWTEADVNQPKDLAETVENDPERASDQRGRLPTGWVVSAFSHPCPKLNSGSVLIQLGLPG
jgi:hypothetical protein